MILTRILPSFIINLKHFALLFLVVLYMNQKAQSQPIYTETLFYSPEILNQIKNKSHVLEGKTTLYFPLANPPHSLEFALYPNAHALRNWAFSDLSRQDMEAFSNVPTGTPLTRGFSEGVLDVLKVKWCQDNLCHPIESAPQTNNPYFIYRNKYKVLSIFNLKNTHFNKIELQFKSIIPRNFSTYGSKDTELSMVGPSFPYLISQPTQGLISFKDYIAHCSTCFYNKETQFWSQRFFLFPGPVRIFTEPAIFQEKTNINGLNVFHETSIPPEQWKEIESAIQNILKELPYIKIRMNDQNLPQALTIRWGNLLKNLVAAQPQEIHISKGYLGVIPFLKEYHRSALVRALIEALIFQPTVSDPSFIDKDILFLKNVISIYSEIGAKNLIKKSHEIKEFSEKLKFLPLFNGILRGKILENNDVFLGSKEKSNYLDRAPFDEISASLNGSQLLERLEWCLKKSEYEGFTSSVMGFLRGEKTQNPILSLLKTASKKCGNELQNLIHLPLAQEQVEVTRRNNCQQIETSSKLYSAQDDCTYISALRHTKETQDSEFFSYNQKFSHDVFDIKSYDKTKKTTQTKSPWLHNETNVVLKQSLGFENRIEGPAPLVGSPSQRIDPRPTDFLLTGFRLRYDSSQSQPELQQGVQWSWSDDPLERSLSITGRSSQESKEVLVLAKGAWPWHGDKIPFGAGTSAEWIKDRFEFKGVCEWGWQTLKGTAFAPQGWIANWQTKMSLLNPPTSSSAGGRRFEHKASWEGFIPLAKLMTWGGKVSFMGSPKEQPLGGSGGVPGHSPGPIKSRNLSLFKTEISKTLMHHSQKDLWGIFGFEHMNIYAAHNGGISEYRWQVFRLKSLQSAEFGFRFYGSFVSQKDQQITLSFLRQIGTLNPRTGFLLSVGQEL